MALERARYDVNGQTLIVVGLPDRRTSAGGRDREVQWCYLKTLEICLFGGNTSAIYRLLERCALQQVFLKPPLLAFRTHTQLIPFATPIPGSSSGQQEGRDCWALYERRVPGNPAAVDRRV